MKKFLQTVKTYQSFQKTFEQIVAFEKIDIEIQIIYMHILRKTYCFIYLFYFIFFNFMKDEYNLLKHVCENCSIIQPFYPINSDFMHFFNSFVAKQYKTKRSFFSFSYNIKRIIGNFKVNNNLLCHVYQGNVIILTNSPNFIVLFRK